jgi:hypothetical protein
MSLPRELVTAVADARDREMGEGDAGRRAQQLAVLRGTLEAWLRGALSTEGAVRALEPREAC